MSITITSAQPAAARQLRGHAPRRFGALLVSGAVAGVVLLGGSGQALAAAAPSSQDVTFMKANEQTNLAEITVGTIAMSKAQDQQTRDLASTTVSDHKAAQAKLMALAASLGVTLPTAPNQMQQQAAAKLQADSASAFDLDYATIQVTGHQLSISDTNAEISSGSDGSVVGYAQYYLPVATMHLKMSQDLVATLTGAPTAVPAGLGGMASAGGSTDPVGVVLTGAGVLVLLTASFVIVARRRTAGQHSS